MTARRVQPTPHDQVRVLQRKLYRAAKARPTRTFGVLYDKVCSKEVLDVAWNQVRRNRGAAGVDGKTIEAIEADGVEQFLTSLQEELRAQRYHSAPVRRVFIPKPDGQQRPLGIPWIRDRVVQAAVRLVIEPLFEASFRPSSYGFRPKRGAKQAIADIRKWVTYGYDQVIDLDLKSYFDTIDHALLLKLVARRVRDPRVLRLMRRWLRAGVMRDGGVEETLVGTPQGGVSTPRTQKVTFSLSGWSPAGVRGRCLIYVVNSNMYMSHDSCDQGRESAAAQRSLPAAAAAEGTGRGGAAARPGVCSVAPASLPLPPGSGGAERAGARGRANRRDHLQTPGEHRPRASRVRPAQRAFLGARS